MSDTPETLRGKIAGAGDLQTVVRTMKALAASNIGQCEAAVRSLSHYHEAVELGLHACLRDMRSGDGETSRSTRSPTTTTRAIVFGSDQGLVGQFNEVVADLSIRTLAALPGAHEVWAVGERVKEHLVEARLAPVGVFPVPNSVQAITGLVGRLLLDGGETTHAWRRSSLWVFNNRPVAGASYEPVSQRLLPLDFAWRERLTRITWPTRNLPEVWGGALATLRSFVREYLFISLFRACAESMASENASRLAAMQRAEKNIDDLLEQLQGQYHQLRQDGIDEELFDVIAGYEALLAPG